MKLLFTIQIRSGVLEVRFRLASLINFFDLSIDLGTSNRDFLDSLKPRRRVLSTQVNNTVG